MLSLQHASALISPPVSPRLFLLDRDGCINRDVGAPGVLRETDLELLPGAAKAICKVRNAGHLVVIVTNQSCVGKGLISSKELGSVHDRLRALLAEHGAAWDAIYVCEDAMPSSRKKPSPGMLLEAMARYTCEPASCIMVGDSWSDIVAARRAGCEAALVATGHGERVLRALVGQGIALPCTIDLDRVSPAERDGPNTPEAHIDNTSPSSSDPLAMIPNNQDCVLQFSIQPDVEGTTLLRVNFPCSVTESMLIREALPVRFYQSLEQTIDMCLEL